MGFRVIGYLHVPAILENYGGRGKKGRSAGVEEIKTGSAVLKTIYWNMDPEAPAVPCVLEKDGRFTPCQLEGNSFKQIQPFLSRRSKEF